MGRPHHGRGALSNPTGRFEAETRTHFDDEWDLATEDSAKLTELIPERARSIITHNDSPDIPFEQSINPYR
ncbi:radical SAM protein, partial [Myxococcota bacterium]|nr:radical SAM protein [Myxococcota bacterium]